MGSAAAGWQLPGGAGEVERDFNLGGEGPGGPPRIFSVGGGSPPRRRAGLDLLVPLPGEG